MGEDRDLAVIGAGAGLAILALLLPLPFGVRGLIAFFLMGLALILAFLRLGPDRLPAEVLLWRRLRYRRTPRRRVYMRFQSHAGSIEAPASAAGAPHRLFVSIPRWFD